MQNSGSIPLVNPVSIFAVIVAVFVALGYLGRAAKYFVS
jgi:hypothetical protein